MPDHGYQGWTSIKKSAGTAGGGLTIGDQRDILCLEVNPSNPLNNSYMNVINAGGYPNSFVTGRGSPGLQMHTFLKPYNGSAQGWSDSKIFNSFLGLGTDSNTDKLEILLADEIANRQYNWSRCNMVEFSAAAVGGPIATRLGFASRWGDSECPYGTTLAGGEVIAAVPTFALPNGGTTVALPDPGQAANVIKLGISGANKVKSFSVMMMRPQMQQYHFNGDRAPEEVVSGQASGLLTIEQEADASITPTTSMSISFCTDKAIGTGRFRLDLLLNLDSFVKNPIPGIVSNVLTYSLIDVVTGGNPFAFTAY